MFTAFILRANTTMDIELKTFHPYAQLHTDVLKKIFKSEIDISVPYSLRIHACALLAHETDVYFDILSQIKMESAERNSLVEAIHNSPAFGDFVLVLCEQENVEKNNANVHRWLVELQTQQLTLNKK